MRLLLPAVIALVAAPAFAQDAPRPAPAPEADDREVEIEIETDDADGPVRYRVERDGDERDVVIRRRGVAPGTEEDVVRFRVPGPEGLAMFERLGDAPFAHLDLGDAPRMLREFSFGRGISDETRTRLRELQDQAHDLAREARTAEGRERDDAVRRLDAVLGELFDVRGQARREEAEALRERAQELMDEADEKEASLRDRSARRQALIEARRAELLGETPTEDW